ncbi:F0F1 ATP synthase subunit delta [Salipiger sp. IMCC34102]|uniref:F0F1 ATP synthase subunit delta n=1 Tax=Salipiger sp. IMCC34102 TaxID=2510647 RepID=UPI00101CCA9A|nr:F0F1 ATP synthase subunit delta [Salipiger sp. IMCC34102]RYH03817.1 F0F1 ATP synthase subunit delta [Salipiger sp. IMCC34102]
MDVSEPASISHGIAGRYALAVFELAKDGNELETMERDVDALRAALAESDDLRDLIHSPVYGRDSQSAAMNALAQKMGLSATMGNTLRLLADKRRLFVLPSLLAQLKEMSADARGEVTAEVTSAKALTETQRKKLSQTLTDQVGREVSIEETVDPAILGGLIVKVGSKMIDTSIRSKLNALQNSMKEAG